LKESDFFLLRDFFLPNGYNLIPCVYLFVNNMLTIKKSTMKMKLITALFGLLFFTACKKADVATTTPLANTQISIIPQSAVPPAIVNAFTASFTGATEVEWHRSAAGIGVEFNHQSQHHTAEFEDDGHQKSHSVSGTSAVPQVVLNAFRARNPNDNVYEWSLRNDGTWKAHFMRGTVKWETTFTGAGVFVKEEHD
jgi:hypothetical protein